MSIPFNTAFAEDGASQQKSVNIDHGILINGRAFIPMRDI
jgi:hypothetical protein